MPHIQTASGKITTVTKFSKTCNCWTRRNSKNFSMDTTTMKTLTKKWTKKSKKWNNNRIDNNAKLAVSEHRQLSVRKQEQETRVVWSPRVKEMILQVNFINTRKARTYYSNHQIWTWISELIKLDRCHSLRSSLPGPRNIDNERLIFLRAIVIRPPRDSPDSQDLVHAVPQ